MTRGYTGIWGAVLAGILAAPLASAQVLDNKSLSGKFYFRHVSLQTDGSGAVNDARSLIGAITFDGSGGYSFTAQQTQGSAAAAARTGSGKYSVDAAGIVAMDNPIRSGPALNARFGPEALLGSTTEGVQGDTTFDLFAAIPASTAPQSNASLNGSYQVVSLEVPNGTATLARNALFTLISTGQGRFNDIAITGHAANVAGGAPSTPPPISGATYSIATDGTGSATFGAPSTTALLSGPRTFYVSRSGNLILGGSTSAGGHDILLGVKALAGATNASWNGTYWSAGLRLAAGDTSAFSGSAAARGGGKLYWTRRIKPLGFANLDFTGVNDYSLQADGTSRLSLTQVALGAAGAAFAGAAIDPIDPGAYEVYFGVQMHDLTKGSGVYLNPQGVANGGAYAPPGNPISPGQFIILYGSGLAPSSATASIPYPLTLNGVSVLINDRPAPLYFVSGAQINALVPFATQPGRATIVVQNGSNKSAPVQVTVARTNPGVYSLDQNGIGAGAILHADYTLVGPSKPAAKGETVLIYLTGLGAVDPAAGDGIVPGASPLKNVVSDVSVLVAGRPGTVLFKGLSPQYPGLYQLNVTLPVGFAATGNLPLAIQTPDAFTDQVDIAVQ